MSTVWSVGHAVHILSSLRSLKNKLEEQSHSPLLKVAPEPHERHSSLFSEGAVLPAHVWQVKLGTANCLSVHVKSIEKGLLDDTRRRRRDDANKYIVLSIFIVRSPKL